ncbi:MAG: peptide chain release factor N(5)-glutamine methyltransferase [Syntrophomonadaceae bacterium]|nr:peptide chain release factor N(5)-glutamine methyltransferase [Syntrophomonadaceae bacterium]
MQEIWTIQALVEWTTNRFAREGFEHPRLEAEVLLAHVLDADRVHLYVNYHQPVNQEERQRFRELVHRRLQGQPVAYLVGYREFYSLRFEVGPGVLVPRPETELLVDVVLDLAGRGEPSHCIADVGTGSGAIAVTLARHLPRSSLWAIDLSAPALDIAQRNIARHGVEERVTLLHGDLLEPLEKRGLALDMVVANLPYVPSAEASELGKGLLRYEPRVALDGGHDGLALYRRLIPQAGRMLVPGGYLVVEIDHRQGQAMLGLLQEFSEVSVLPDLTGRDRVVVARKGGAESADPLLQGRPPLP